MIRKNVHYLLLSEKKAEDSRYNEIPTVLLKLYAYDSVYNV